MPSAIIHRRRKSWLNNKKIPEMPRWLNGRGSPLCLSTTKGRPRALSNSTRNQFRFNFRKTTTTMTSVSQHLEVGEWTMKMAPLPKNIQYKTLNNNIQQERLFVGAWFTSSSSPSWSSPQHHLRCTTLFEIGAEKTGVASMHLYFWRPSTSSFRSLSIFLTTCAAAVFRTKWNLPLISGSFKETYSTWQSRLWSCRWWGSTASWTWCMERPIIMLNVAQ